MKIAHDCQKLVEFMSERVQQLLKNKEDSIIY